MPLPPVRLLDGTPSAANRRGARTIRSFKINVGFHADRAQTAGSCGGVAACHGVHHAPPPLTPDTNLLPAFAPIRFKHRNVAATGRRQKIIYPHPTGAGIRRFMGSPYRRRDHRVPLDPDPVSFCHRSAADFGRVPIHRQIGRTFGPDAVIASCLRHLHQQTTPLASALGPRQLTVRFASPAAPGPAQSNLSLHRDGPILVLPSYEFVAYSSFKLKRYLSGWA